MSNHITSILVYARVLKCVDFFSQSHPPRIFMFSFVCLFIYLFTFVACFFSKTKHKVSSRGVLPDDHGLEIIIYISLIPCILASPLPPCLIMCIIK